MIEAYKIGIALALTGETNATLARLTAQFERLEVIVGRIRGAVTGMNRDMGGMADSATRAASAWERAAAAMERAQRAGASTRAPASTALRLPFPLAIAPGGSGGGYYPPGAGATGAGGAGGGGYYLPPSSAAPLRLAGPGGAGGGGGGGNGGGGAAPGGSGGMPPIRLPPNYGNRPPALSQHDLAMRALGYGIIGKEIFDVGASAFTAAADVDQMRATLVAQGLTATQATSTVEAARTAARATPGITIAQALEAAMDLRTVLGGTATDPASPVNAIAALPGFVQNLAIYKKLGDQNGDQSFAGVKAAELLGDLIDEKTNGVSGANLQSFLNASAKVAIATKMRVGPTDLLAFVKKARASDLNLSDDYLFKILPSLILESGGSITGTSEMAAWRQFAAGTMTKAKYEQLKQWHVLDAKTSWSHGHVANISKHLQDYSLFDSNPAQWVWNVLQPKLAAAGITDRVQQAQIVGTIMTNTGGGLFSSLISQKAGIQKDVSNLGAAATGADAAAVLNTGADAKLANFHASLLNLMTDLGGPLVAPAGAAMDKLRIAIDGLGQAAHQNQGITLAVEGVTGALGALSTGLSAFFGVKLLRRWMGFGKDAGGSTGATGGTGLAGRSAASIGAGGDVSAEAVLSEVTGLAPAVLSRLLGPIVAAVAIAMKPTTANPNEATDLKSALDRLGKQQVHLTGNVYLDGKTIGKLAAQSLADSLSGPKMGVTNYDPAHGLLHAGVPTGGAVTRWAPLDQGASLDGEAALGHSAADQDYGPSKYRLQPSNESQ